jgi:plasmid stabilization system protein ParE
MTPPAEVVFHRLARSDYVKARGWYLKEGGEVLAASFVREVDNAVNRIAEGPLRGQRFRTKFRWVRLHRFPYLLYYHVLEPTRVIVLAVAHGSRRPGYWIRRAKNL